jgi:2-iminoacetate synthase
MRNALSELCMTMMSAGSRTDPGGYSGLDAAEQFTIDDNRSVQEVVAMLESRGLEPVFTDWSAVMK